MNDYNPKHCIPFVAGIIERKHKGKTQVLLQTRWMPEWDPLYSGTYEFVAGRMDIAFENVYETLRRELKEELGLSLKRVIGDSRTKVYTPRNNDASFAFRPYCCTQQLKAGEPWIGFIFRCEVEDDEPVPQLDEVKDPFWLSVEGLRKLVQSSPEKFFTLELPALEYYLAEIEASQS